MKITLIKQGPCFLPHDDDLESFLKLPDKHYVVNLKGATPKEVRSLEQNNMQFKWYRDMEKQGDMTAQEYRAYCKLNFGVPLRQLECPEFRGIYQRLIRPLDYEDKLSLMVAPIDLPITSEMSVETMAKYLKKVSDFGLEQGFRMTGLEHLTEWLAADERKAS